MASVLNFFSKTTPKTPKLPTPEKTKPPTPEKTKPPKPTTNRFSMSIFTNLFKNSEPQEKEKISTPIIAVDSINNVNNEYTRIKNNFLEEIQLKIQKFWTLNDFCKTECANRINDEETKKQLENMYQTAATGDFLSMCGRINSNISECKEALKMQREIQELFIIYKTDTDHNISQVVLDEEAKFYKMTKTKIMKKTNGGRKTRLSKPKAKKTQKRQK
jgi:hypothetical protein